MFYGIYFILYIFILYIFNKIYFIFHILQQDICILFFQRIQEKCYYTCEIYQSDRQIFI